MKKAFVYPSKAPYRSGSRLRRTEGQRAPLQLDGVSSPRKRKRSPDVPPPQPLDKGQSSSVKDPYEEEDEDAYLDQLGTAALEEYELTQRSPQQQQYLGGTSHHPPSSSSSSSSSSISSTSRVQPSHAGISAIPRQPSSSSLHPVGVQLPIDISQTSHPLSAVAADKEREKELNRRLKEYEEKTFEKDGEVKLLRSELKKKEEQLRELHTRLVTEHRIKEEEYQRKNKSLSTQLEFKEQELTEWKDRCSSLELRQKNSGSVIHTTPVGTHSKPPQRKTTDHTNRTGNQFLSTETFMPLSQSSGNVTPVQVPSRSPKRGVSTTTTERTYSPEPKRSASNQPSSSNQGSSRLNQPSGDGAHQYSTDYIPILPWSEISSQKLLELLSTPELLKVPHTKNEDSDEEREKGGEGGDGSLEAEALSLPGILSLLHFPQHSSSSSRSSSLFPSTSTTNTPVTRLQWTTPSSTHNLSSDLSIEAPPPLPSTPKRDLRLRTRQPSTISRTNVARDRGVKDHFPLRKTQSAQTVQLVMKPAITTVADRDGSTVSKTLLDSLDVHSLTSNIRSMLTEHDSSLTVVPSGFRSISATPHISAPPSLSQSLQLPACAGIDTTTPSVDVQLLELIGNVVIRYVAQQRESAQSAPPMTSMYSDHDSFSFDNTTESPRSSGSGKTLSSTRNTSELSSPPRGDQSLLYRSLRALHTLLTYRSKARDQLLAPVPPKYHLLDDVAEGSASEEGLRVGRNGSKEEEEEEMETEAGEKKEERNIPTKPSTREWKGKVLQQMTTSGELSRLWVPHNPPILEKTSGSWRRRSTSAPLAVTPLGHGIRVEEERAENKRRYVPLSRKGGELLESLLQLVSPQWKESNEVILLVLEILVLLIQDCPLERLERFVPLLERDGLDIHLADDPLHPFLCLQSLKIVTLISTSPQLINHLCPGEANSGGCLLQLCYEFFTMTATEDHHLQYMIHMQLIQLISNLMLIKSGLYILFESDCPCCYELLKYVVGLIQHLIQDVSFCEDLSSCDLLLLYSLVVLLNRISLTDRHFERHREHCEYVFLFSVRSLKYLFDESTDVQIDMTIKYILSELYAEYCEEDTLENEGSSSGHDTRQDMQ